MWRVLPTDAYVYAEDKQIEDDEVWTPDGDVVDDADDTPGMETKADPEVDATAGNLSGKADDDDDGRIGHADVSGVSVEEKPLSAGSASDASGSAPAMSQEGAAVPMSQHDGEGLVHSVATTASVDTMAASAIASPAPSPQLHSCVVKTIAVPTFDLSAALAVVPDTDAPASTPPVEVEAFTAPTTPHHSPTVRAPAQNSDAEVTSHGLATPAQHSHGPSVPGVPNNATPPRSPAHDDDEDDDDADADGDGDGDDVGAGAPSESAALESSLASVRPPVDSRTTSPVRPPVETHTTSPVVPQPDLGATPIQTPTRANILHVHGIEDTPTPARHSPASGTDPVPSPPTSPRQRSHSSSRGSAPGNGTEARERGVRGSGRGGSGRHGENGSQSNHTGPRSGTAAGVGEGHTPAAVAVRVAKVPLRARLLEDVPAARRLFVIGGTKKTRLGELVEGLGAQVSKRKGFDDACTHVVVDSLKRTEKLLCACAAGKVANTQRARAACVCVCVCLVACPRCRVVCVPSHHVLCFRSCSSQSTCCKVAVSGGSYPRRTSRGVPPAPVENAHVEPMQPSKCGREPFFED